MSSVQTVTRNASLSNVPGETPFRKIVSRLEPGKATARGGIKTRCPAHRDTNPSLEVWENPDGSAGLKCWAGCSTDEVLVAIGLPRSALFPTRPARNNSKRTIAVTYDYHDENGNLLFQTVRFVPKGFSQRRPDGKGGWIWKLGDTKRVPYRLPGLKKAIEASETVFIPEGEKDVGSLAAIGLPATTNPMGACNWQDSYSQYFAGAKVVVLPDNDGKGQKHAQQVANSLRNVAASVKVLELPGLPDKGDVTDWLQTGRTKEELLALVDQTPEWEPKEQAIKRVGAASMPGLPQSEDPEKLTQAQILIHLATEKAEFFKTPEGEVFATFPVAGHKETSPIKQRAFRLWLRREYYRFTEEPGVEPGKVPGAQALQDALNMLEAQAFFNAPEMPVHARLAEHEGKIYLDLGNDTWQVVEVSSKGWQVINNSPVKFWRPKGMLPLPVPEKGGKIEDLRPFVNTSSEADWCLSVACKIGRFNPSIPYIVENLQGGEGTGKSTEARVSRSIIDPVVAPLRPAPEQERDLAIAAKNSWVLTLDNLSNVPVWLSDALCRIATGGGYATRKLYEDDEQTLFDYQRPVILTSIDKIIKRHDLLDRAIVITLPKIPETERLEEKRFWAEFEKIRPKIIGAFLDAVAVGLGRWNEVKLDRLPRMADFAKWVVACEPALPWEPGAFMKAYTEARSKAIEGALEADIVTVAVRDYLDERESFEGTMTELLTALEGYVPEKIQKTKAWPKTPQYLSSRLREAATSLERIGICCVFDVRVPGSGRRLIQVTRQASDAEGHSGNEEGFPYEPF